MNETDVTIDEAIIRHLKSVSLSRSENTVRTYRNALNLYRAVLLSHDLPPKETSVRELSEDSVSWFARHLKIYSSSTERLYLSALVGFFVFLATERFSDPDLNRIRKLIDMRSRRPGQRLPQFPGEDIQKILDYAQKPSFITADNEPEALRNLRDRAFLLTLADTGLRVHEACALRRGDIDWNEGKGIVIGKGDTQAVVRFSSRSIEALRAYLSARMKLDGLSGLPLASLPIFARHDRGAGKRVKPITTTTGRNIVKQRVKEALGNEAVGTITPHSFRHYFVTTVLRGSGGNIKMAQELARHKNIAVTQRYAHLSDDELDRGYHEIFEEG